MSWNRAVFANSIILVFTVLFILWSVMFIYRNSVQAIDGQRYFVLYDDAMISMRYAWNFAHGHGLVWNAGERVEGYTNLLMVLLMSFPTALFDKSTAVGVVQIVGIGFALVNAWLMSRIAQHIALQHSENQRQLLRVLAFATGLLYYPLVYWPLMGGDLGPVLCFLLLGVLSVMQNRRWILLTALGLAYLARPDTLLPALVVMAYFVYEARIRAKHISPVQVVGVVGGYALFPIGQTVFRMVYYGALVPNTYTLKLGGMPLAVRLADGIGFIQPFVNDVGWLFVVVALMMLFRPSRFKLLALMFAATITAYQVYVGGDIVPFYWRLTAPAVPLLLIVMFDEALRLIDAGLKRIRLSSALVYLAMIGLTGVTLFFINNGFRAEMIFAEPPHELAFNTGLVNRAVALNALTTQDATIGVTAAGVVPYYTGRYTLDFLGKSDAYIASLPPVLGSVRAPGMDNFPGHVKYDLYYSIVLREPDYVERFSWGQQHIGDWARTYYATVEYRGVLLYFRRDSDYVLWERGNVLD